MVIHTLGFSSLNSSSRGAPSANLRPVLWPSHRSLPVHFSIISMLCIHSLNTTRTFPAHSFLYLELSVYSGTANTLILLAFPSPYPLPSSPHLNSMVSYYNHSLGKMLNSLALSHFAGITHKTIILVKCNSAYSAPVPA